MSTLTLAPYAFPQALDNDGHPLNGGLLYTYLSGSSTPAATYADAQGSAANTNPVVLDASGRYLLYLQAVNYKFVLKDRNDVLLATTDPVGSVGLVTSGVYNIFTFGGDSTSPITSTSYPSGATVDKCHAGTSLFVIDSATIAAGTYALSGMILSSLGDTVTVAIMNLTDGSPDTPLASMSSVSTTGQAVTSGAITFAAGGFTKTYGIKTKTSANSGFAWGIQLVKTA